MYLSASRVSAQRHEHTHTHTHTRATRSNTHTHAHTRTHKHTLDIENKQTFITSNMYICICIHAGKLCRHHRSTCLPACICRSALGKHKRIRLRMPAYLHVIYMHTCRQSMSAPSQHDMAFYQQLPGAKYFRGTGGALSPGQQHRAQAQARYSEQREWVSSPLNPIPEPIPMGHDS